VNWFVQMNWGAQVASNVCCATENQRSINASAAQNKVTPTRRCVMLQLCGEKIQRFEDLRGKPLVEPCLIDLVAPSVRRWASKKLGGATCSRTRAAVGSSLLGGRRSRGQCFMGDKCCITFMSPEGFPKCAAVVMSLSLGRFEISWLPISALAES
jgi:hypothetical protein